MRNLVAGLHHFQNHIFATQKDFWEQLALGQTPSTLFISCSDSRIIPNLITQTDAGELFVLRNAGNIIPAYGASNGGEGATIEYAVSVLNVRDIIVCGHTDCGAMKGLLKPESVRELPLVADWLKHAEATRQILRENYSDHAWDDLLNIAIQENVLVQLENLQTHPCVAARLQRGKLALHGWTYKIETGEVFGFSPEEKRFLPLTEVAVEADSEAVALT